MVNPLGLDILNPRLSWMLPLSPKRGAAQTAWQVIVASTPERLAAGDSDLWDSGRVEGSECLYIAYAGAPLGSRAQCFWKVRVWDEAGAASEWSEMAHWGMGLLDATEWKGQWIGASLAGGHRSAVPAPYLRKEFAIDREVASARLYITARGLYEFSLNGQRVGGDVLTPGDTDYHKRIQYQVYDIMPLLRPGANAAGAVLGDGWYCGCNAHLNRQYYGERAALMAQLEVTFADGQRLVVCSDATWKTAFGPILESDMIQGEIYDARRELPGWDRADFDDSTWSPVHVMADEGVKRVGMRGPTVRPQKELVPIALLNAESPDPIFDMGQNMVGWVRLKLTAKAGTTIRIRFGEMLDEKGRLYTANLRSARATDYYTCKGGGEEIWEPRFTFHGFRYVELHGDLFNMPVKISKETVTGIVVNSDMAETGAFECSDKLVNQLQSNIQWGQRGNYVDIPTDCPQRDERLGWMGDAQAFVRTAAFNFDVSGFFSKWMIDVADAQGPNGELPMVAPDLIPPGDGTPSNGGPAWADAGVICPWTMYLCYGDKGILAEHYEMMRRYVDSLERESVGFIRRHPSKGWGGFGDWLAIDGAYDGMNCFGQTPTDMIGTAFYAYSARLFSRIAAILGNTDDARKYEALFESVRKAYQERFITAAGLLTSGTQTAYVLTLYFDLAPEALRKPFVEALVRKIESSGNKLATGFVGTPYLQHALTQGGRADVAFRLLHQEQWPSWLYAVTQGATTIWERWDGWTQDKGFQTTEMNSFNHYAYGAVGDWLYSAVAGLDADPAEPGFKHVIVKPLPGDLQWARASLETGFGKLSNRWEIKDGVFAMELVVPSNTTATVCLPVPEGAAVTECGKPAAQAEGVKPLGRQNGAECFKVGSGTYRFAAPLK